MTNEAIRLFFAVSALILVGMLAGSEEAALLPTLTTQYNESQIQVVTKVAKADLSTKKIDKSEKKISRRTAAVKKS